MFVASVGCDACVAMRGGRDLLGATRALRCVACDLWEDNVWDAGRRVRCVGCVRCDVRDAICVRYDVRGV